MNSKEYLNKVFRKLSNYNTIIAYTEENESLTDLCKIIDNEMYTLVDLRVSDELKKVFTEHYNVNKYPVLISYGINIYSSSEESKLKQREVNISKYLELQIREMVKSKKIFIFIKGTPEKPECKFTRELINLLESKNLISNRDYKYFNIFLNNRIRSLLKKINDWPTFPQIYIDGVFVGGIDILKKMNENGVFDGLLDIEK